MMGFCDGDAEVTSLKSFSKRGVLVVRMLEIERALDLLMLFSDRIAEVVQACSSLCRVVTESCQDPDPGPMTQIGTRLARVQNKIWVWNFAISLAIAVGMFEL